jgi:hypothetical protein
MRDCVCSSTNTLSSFDHKDAMALSSEIACSHESRPPGSDNDGVPQFRHESQGPDAYGLKI